MLHKLSLDANSIAVTFSNIGICVYKYTVYLASELC